MLPKKQVHIHKTTNAKQNAFVAVSYSCGHSNDAIMPYKKVKTLKQQGFKPFKDGTTGKIAYRGKPLTSQLCCPSCCQ